jgi:hypothetical protein
MLEKAERDLVDDWLQKKRSPETITLVILLMRSKTTQREKEAVLRRFEFIYNEVSMTAIHERARLSATDPRREQDSAATDGGRVAGY